MFRSQSYRSRITRRAFPARRTARCGFRKILITRVANLAGLFSTKRSSPGVARTPSKASLLATTGRPIAIASSTLFWTPRAIRTGATLTAARERNGRTSGTDPVTVIPGSSASR